MTYLIASRPKGTKLRWTTETVGFRYSNIEAAEAHLTYLRFNNRKVEYVIKRDEDWDGPVRVGFKADDVKAVSTVEFRPMADPPEAYRAGGLMEPVTAQPRGRRLRNGNT